MNPKEGNAAAEYSGSIQRILDIELPITVNFGSAVWPLKEILSMTPGTVLELDKTADEPVVVKVNDKVFARGEVVVVDGYYGVKIQEIDSTENRIKSLGGAS